MDNLLMTFKELYGEQQPKLVKSPLRICPLGAHVDHQDGVVTGMALDSNVEMVFAESEDGYIRVRSMDFPDEEYFHVDSVSNMLPGFWGNYLRGTVLSLKRDHQVRKGFKR